jgi:hypothetical protein
MNFLEAITEAAKTAQFATRPGMKIGYTHYSAHTGTVYQVSADDYSETKATMPSIDSLMANDWLVLDRL